MRRERQGILSFAFDRENAVIRDTHPAGATLWPRQCFPGAHGDMRSLSRSPRHDPFFHASFSDQGGCLRHAVKRQLDSIRWHEFFV
jgi:hypothetical protein